MQETVKACIKRRRSPISINTTKKNVLQQFCSTPFFYLKFIKDLSAFPKNPEKAVLMYMYVMASTRMLYYYPDGAYLYEEMHLGCWKDHNTDKSFGTRDFHTILMDDYNGLSLVHCLPGCKNLGFRYAAIEVSEIALEKIIIYLIKCYLCVI